MKTIRRNAHRKIAAIALTIVKVRIYDQVRGGTVDLTEGITAASAVSSALAYLNDPYYGSKLYDNEDGSYTLHVHSNLYFYLYTQAHLDQAAADKAERDARFAAERKQRTAITAPATAVCEYGNNHEIETCPGCGTEDANGDQVEQPVPTTDGRYVATKHWQHDDWTVYDQEKDSYQMRGLNEVEAIEQAERLNSAPVPTVTVTRTRMAIGEQIAKACEALGIELGHGWSKGAAHYEVNGKIYTAGELADLVLVGGFAANYGGNEVRVNWDSPLAPGQTQERRAGRALMITRELQARMGTATARELEEVAVSLMDMLHGWAIESAPRPKVDYPSGAAEPDVDVRAVQCLRTGEVWRRDGVRWVTGEGDAARWCIWYRMNETDPMSEGFNVYRKG